MIKASVFLLINSIKNGGITLKSWKQVPYKVTANDVSDSQAFRNLLAQIPIDIDSAYTDRLMTLNTPNT